MTEDQAKTKWCPIPMKAIQAGDHWTAAHIDITGERASNCIASECMWWTWDYQNLDPEYANQDEGHCGAVK